MLVRRNETVPYLSRLFGDFFDKEFLDWSNTNYSPTNTTLPAVNIKETKESFVVKVAAPGMDKKDFQIDLKDNLLTISSEKKEDKEVVEGTYTRKEFSYQSFSRSFTLPKDIVDSERINARYENGELTIILPKKEESRPRDPRRIEIS